MIRCLFWLTFLDPCGLGTRSVQHAMDYSITLASMHRWEGSFEGSQP